MNKNIEYLLSLPKSFYFCMRCLPLRQALKLPIIVHYNVMVRNIGKIETGGICSVRIGFGNVGIYDKKRERFGTIMAKRNSKGRHTLAMVPELLLARMGNGV